jgi:hypothetical protein
MATMYQVDLNKNIEPAMANPSVLQQAAQSQAAAIRTLGEGATELYKYGVEQDIKSMTEESRSIANKMFESNQQAQDAGLAAANAQKYVLPGLFQRAEEASKSDDPEVKAQGLEQLASFSSQLAKLKAASEGGMKPEQFIANVEVVARKAIAKYPGLADTIRQQIAKATGLEGADEFTQQRWINRVINPKQGGKDPIEEARQRDTMTFVVNKGFLTEVEAMKLRDTDPAAYYKIENQGREIVRAEAVGKAAKTALDNTNVVNEADANAAWPAHQARYTAGVDAFLLSYKGNKEIEQMVNGLVSGAGTPNFDIGALEVQAKAAVGNVKSALDTMLFNTKQEIRAKFRQSGTAGSELETKQLARADALHKEYVEMYANEKTLPFMLNIMNMKEYENHTFERKRQLASLASTTLSTLGNPPAVQAYFMGGTARQKVKAQSPDLYKLLDTISEGVLTGGANATTSVYDNLAALRNAVSEAKKDGKPLVSDNRTPAQLRAASQLTYEDMKTMLTSSNESKTLDSGSINVISTAITTSQKYGDNYQQLQADYVKLGDKIKQLPQLAQDTIKNNASVVATTVIGQLQADKLAIEQQYGVKLQIGVTPSGKMGVVIPKDTGTPDFTATGQQSRSQQALLLANAARAFESKTAPRLITLSTSRAMVTGEPINAVSNDYANIINSNQPYKGFFSMEPKATEQSATTDTNQQSTNWWER